MPMSAAERAKKYRERLKLLHPEKYEEQRKNRLKHVITIPMSAAERAKRYRERLKFLHPEKYEEQRKNRLKYVRKKINDLTEEQKILKRQEWRLNKKKQKIKKKQKNKKIIEILTNSVDEELSAAKISVKETIPNFFLLSSHDTMETKDFANISLTDFKWLNEPTYWNATEDILVLSTDDKTDFWQKTLYEFAFNTGHVYGVDIKDDFTFEVCVEADFEMLYDQAGLMIYLDEKHWLKSGIEYNDGQPMISSVLTNEVSDWGTGIFPGNPKKFYMRLTRVGTVVCVKYSTDNVTWTLLRLCPFPTAEKYFVGLMACTPKREGLKVKFSNISVTKPVEDILHSN